MSATIAKPTHSKAKAFREADLADEDVLTALGILREHPLPSGMKSVRLEVGEDLHGEPALWIIFRVEKAASKSASSMKRWFDYTQVLDSLLRAKLKRRWPFFDFDEVR